jgi:hypothetical protein
MRSTPVVFVRTLSAVTLFWWRKIMQQSRLGDVACLDNMLKVPLFVAFNLLEGITIACSCYQSRSIDDELTQVSECLVEARQDLFRWPDVGRGVLRETRVFLC